MQRWLWVFIGLLSLSIAGCSAAPLGTIIEPTPSSTAMATSTNSASATGAAGPAPGTPPTVARKPLIGKKIVLDPGHNGGNAKNPSIINRQVPDGRGGTKKCNTTGTAAQNGYAEHSLNWATANMLASKLKAHGAEVIWTRDSDTGVGPCVDKRAQIGNDIPADLVLSIHADGNNATQARGFHVIISPAMAGGDGVSAQSKRFAELIIQRFVATGMPKSTYIGRGSGLSVRPDLAGLNLSKVPAVMLEAGNMRHAEDARLLQDDAFRANEATALVEAIMDYFGK